LKSAEPISVPVENKVIRGGRQREAEHVESQTRARSTHQCPAPQYQRRAAGRGSRRECVPLVLSLPTPTPSPGYCPVQDTESATAVRRARSDSPFADRAVFVRPAKSTSGRCMNRSANCHDRNQIRRTPGPKFLLYHCKTLQTHLLNTPATRTNHYLPDPRAPGKFS
jgi:hypothetical protein